MTIVGRLFAVLMLVTFAPLAGADVRYPAPDAGADVFQQQDDVQQDSVLLEEEEEEDEEPDCE